MEEQSKVPGAAALVGGDSAVPPSPPNCISTETVKAGLRFQTGVVRKIKEAEKFGFISSKCCAICLLLSYR